MHGKIRALRPRRPPQLDTAIAVIAESTGKPALAAYVCDDWCAAVYTAVPGGAVRMLHLPDIDVACEVFLHRPDPPGCEAAAATDDLIAWSAAAGLCPNPDRLAALLGCGSWCGQLENVRHLVFELMLALGFQQISAPIPQAFSVEGRRFGHITDGHPAWLAEKRLRERRRTFLDGGEVIAAAAWEADVLDLEAALWRAAYAENPDTDGLARRAAAAYRTADFPKRY